MKSTISTKIIVLCIAIVVLSCAVLGGISLYRDHDLILTSKIQEDVNEVELLTSAIHSKLEELKNDALFLASTPPVEGIIRASQNNGIDPNDGSTEKQWQDRIAIIFKEMLHSKRNYVQIRYIGTSSDGRELVRMERKGGKIYRTINEDLQSKAGAEYFKKSFTLGRNEVLLSKIELNREFGKVVKPAQLVIRALVPIYETRKKPFGLIVINMSYNDVLSELRMRGNEEIKYVVTNQSGEFLFHSDSNLDLGYSRNSVKKITSRYPEAKSFLSSESTLTTIGKERNAKNLIVGKKLFYDQIDTDNYLGIFLITSRSIMEAKVLKGLYSYLIIVIVIVFLSILAAYAFSKYLTVPLQKLTKFIEDISRGQADLSELEVSANDEIGVLAKTLKNMSLDLRDKDSALLAQKAALDESAIVAETNNKGIITYANQKFCDISGFTSAELIGSDHRIINSGFHSKEFIADLWNTIRSGKTWVGEIKNKNKSGEFYWVYTTIFPVRNKGGTVEKFIAIRFDITSRKKAESDLRIAIDDAQRAAKFKSDFLANMSHEIRTPISGVIGMNGFLAETQLDDVQRKYVESIRDSANTLLVVINDILDLSKIEAGKLELESHTFSLEKQIEGVVFMLNEKALAKGLTLQFALSSEIPELIKTDSIRIKQILINLINNAIKFTERGGVYLSVSATFPNKETVKIKFNVRDTGIGIPNEKIEEIFNSFSQAEASTTRRFGGTGLGLSISRQLAELLGGRIWVESEVGIGSNFYFTIMAKMGVAADLPEHSASMKLADDSDLAQKIPLKILIAEDNLTNQIIIRTLLESMGYAPEIVGDGVMAVDKVVNNNFDLIFMDIQMPKMDGIEATRKIHHYCKSNKENPPWIIALTANVFKEDRKRYFDANMDGFLSKPVDKSMVYRAILDYSKRVSSLGDEFGKSGNVMRPDDEKLVFEMANADSLEIFDTLRIDSIRKIKPEIASEILTHFLNNWNDFVHKIDNAISNQNRKELKFQVHTFIGLTGNVGAVQVMSYLQNLERLADSGSEADQRREFIKMQEAIDAVIPLMRTNLAA